MREPRTARWIRASVLAGALAGAACRREAPALETPLLWHGDPGFELLVEARNLAPPPSLGGNRLLTGWRGWRTGLPARDDDPATTDEGAPRGERRRGGTVVYAPFRPLARLEVVSLGAAPGRALLLDLAEAAPHAGRVHAVAAGRDLGDVALADPVRIALPDDLPLGRVPIDVGLPEGIAIRGAGLSSARPAGSARLDGDALVQTGDSLVEMFARVPARTATGTAAEDRQARLVGRFEPPADADVDARFELSAQGPAAGDTARFVWTPPSRGGIDVSLPLPDGAVRIRLLARGTRAAGTWRALHVEDPEHPPARVPPPPRLAPARPAPPSLVVVYVLDALRADRVGHLGAGPERTPTLDRLAAEGLTFMAHRSVAPNTLPSTKSLFTGRTWRAGGGLALPAGVPTLAELVRAAGYRTAMVSGNQNVSSTFGMTRGFDFDAPGVKFPPPPGERARFNDNAARAGRAAAAWVRSLAPGEPGFLYVHVIHPHNPYDPPPELARRFAGGIASRIDGGTDTLRDVDRGDRIVAEADRARLRALYAASLAYADRELATLVEAVTRGRAPGDVLFAVTADHGEELFDHGGLLHGYTLYEEMLRIPLILWCPGRLSPGRVERPTDTIDLFATLLALTGATPPPDVAGRSLLDPRPPAAPSPRFAAASAVRGGIYGVRGEHWKVVLAPRSGLQWGMGSGVGRVRDPELVFDLAADPGERDNLAGTSNVEVGWLRSELLRWIAAGAPESADDAGEPVLDEEARQRLKALGYIGN